MKKKVLVIVGPTASGKSDVAVHLAQKFSAKGSGAEIISADSRQVYKGLNIGTGKITEKEMLGIPHHLLDIADPMQRFTASDYRKLGEIALKNILNRNKLAIIVGGTGLYIDALSCAINFPEVPANTELRNRLSERSAEELIKMLKKKDPVRASEIDSHNKIRIIRALEIVGALGKVPKLKPTDSPYEFVYIGLNPAKERLDQRILNRLEERLDGMIEEGRNLHASGLSYERMHELGLEYRYVAMYLKSEISKVEMLEKLNIEIRKYARRQMTWFKRNQRIKWFGPDEYEEIERYAAGVLG